jgi:hypothetical protein
MSRKVDAKDRQLVFGKDAYPDCLTRVITMVGMAGLMVMMPMEMQGLDADDASVRAEVEEKRKKYLGRKFWNINGRGLETNYKTNDDDCEEMMQMVRAQVQNIVYPFLDVAGDRLRPKGAHPEDLFAWIDTHFGGRKTDRVEQLEEQMKQLRMADFEDVQSYMNAHRAIWATIEQIDPSYSEQKALRFLVNPRYLLDPFKSQGEYFAAAMRANVVQDYSIIKEAMLKTAFDAGLVSNHIHLDGWKKKPGQGQVPKPSPMSAGEKDEAFIANENSQGREIELLRLQLQVSQSELALMVASGRGPGPRTMDKPAGGKSERKPTECWNKWCKQVGHRRDQCKTPKPADWEDRRGRDDRGYVAVVETVSELQGEIIHVPLLLPDHADSALLAHGEPRKLTVDGAATSDVSSLSFGEFFTTFEAVENQVLKTAGGDVKILGRATMVVELLDDQILITLRGTSQWWQKETCSS